MSDELLCVRAAAQLVSRPVSTIHGAIRNGHLTPARYGQPGPGNGHLLRRDEVLARWPDPQRARTRKGGQGRPEHTCAYCGAVFVAAYGRSAAQLAKRQRHFCCKSHFFAYVRLSPEGMTLAEAGRILGCTRQNVSVLLRRGTLADLRVETVLALKRQRTQ